MVNLKESQIDMLNQDITILRGELDYFKTLVGNSEVLRGQLALRSDGNIDEYSSFAENNKKKAEFFEQVSRDLKKDTVEFDQWFSDSSKEIQNQKELLESMGNVIKTML